MLSLTRDLLRKTQDKSANSVKPLTVCFWSDFASNPAVMYELFAPNPRQLDYNPEKVKVMGTADGMIKLVQYTNSTYIGLRRVYTSEISLSRQSRNSSALTS